MGDYAIQTYLQKNTQKAISQATIKKQIIIKMKMMEIKVEIKKGINLVETMKQKGYFGDFLAAMLNTSLCIRDFL